MWVKICANTCIEDALEAAKLEADAVGFVFAPSKRRVDAAQVRSIVDVLPDEVERVGVFAGAGPEEIGAAVEQAGLQTVQLHGGIDLELAERLRRRLGPGIGIIHTVHWQVGQDEAAEQEIRRQLASLAPGERVLVDARVGSASGGLGVPFDWERARGVLHQVPALKLIVAGGLRPGNVAQAISVLTPFGVDVASGVEADPGRKDWAKLKQFMQNARRA